MGKYTRVRSTPRVRESICCEQLPNSYGLEVGLWASWKYGFFIPKGLFDIPNEKLKSEIMNTLGGRLRDHNLRSIEACESPDSEGVRVVIRSFKECCGLAAMRAIGGTLSRLTPKVLSAVMSPIKEGTPLPELEGVEFRWIYSK